MKRLPRIAFLALAGVTMLASGCAHVRKQDAAFHSESLKAVPAVRVFAWQQLKRTTEEDVRILATTEPRIDHASYDRVNFHWPNLCTVVATPPPCKPLIVFDYRPKR